MSNNDHAVCTMNFSCNKPEYYTCNESCIDQLDSDKPYVCLYLGMKTQRSI